MTDKIFSQLNNGDVISFDPLTDTLIFGTVDASAITLDGDATHAIFSYGGKTITLSGVSVNAMAPSNVSVSGGGSFHNGGDNASTPDVSDLANSIYVGAAVTGGSVVYGRGGSDIIDFTHSDAVTSSLNTANNVAYGGTGNDAMTGGSGNDLLFGGSDNDTLTGNAGNDTLYGGAGNDSIVAGNGNDVVNGNAGDDTIDASSSTLAAAHTLGGGQGQDSIVAATVAGSTGDIINGGLGNDTIVAGSGADVVGGGEGNDLISQAATASLGDSLNGGAGFDTISDNATAASADTIHGGLGADSISLSADGHGDLVYGDGGHDTISVSGASGLDTIFGGDGNDSIIIANANGAANNILASGGNGNDTFTIDASGDIGNSTLTGGAGADSYVITLGATGTDLITVSDYLPEDSVTLVTAGALSGVVTTINSTQITIANSNAGASDILTLSTTGSDTIAGTFSGTAGIIGWNNSSTTNTVTGGTNADLLLSDAGSDVLNGGAGADTIFGGAGNDTIDAGTGATADAITAGSGDDSVTIHNATQASIAGGTGTDTLTIASILAETYHIGHASTVINGFEHFVVGETLAAAAATVAIDADLTTGTDVVAGSTVTLDASSIASTSSLAMTDAGDANVHLSITGSAGADSIILDAQATYGMTVTGGGGADTITGGSQGDSISAAASTVGVLLSGGAGNDTLIGGTGADTLIGGTGVDSLNGGTGSDFYRYSEAGSGTNSDVIAQSAFTVNDGTDHDKIDISHNFVALTSLDGSTVAPTGASGTLQLENSSTITSLAASAANVLKLTLTMGTTTFGDALGSSDLTVGANATLVATVFYDATDGQAVVGYVSSGAGNAHITNTDTFTEIARIGMSVSDYGNFDANNIHFF